MAAKQAATIAFVCSPNAWVGLRNPDGSYRCPFFSR
jgi:hypothetical protein